MFPLSSPVPAICVKNKTSLLNLGAVRKVAVTDELSMSWSENASEQDMLKHCFKEVVL